MQIDVESELTTAIAPMGGVHVSTLVGASPAFENADFIFQDQKVIAELKCLDVDKIIDEVNIEKASQIYLNELNQGKAPALVFGTVHLTTKGFSDECVRKIIKIYRDPIERFVKKANNQIKETAIHFDLVDFKGLLIVANNNHSALDPWHGWYILNEIFKQNIYSGINGAVYFSANQEVIDPKSGRPLNFWAEFRRSHIPSLDPGFLQTLRKAWHQHFTQLMGESTYHEMPIDSQQLAQLENKPKG